MNIYLQKNLKRTEENKQPYFRLVLPPAEEGGKWTEIGALWKAKTGTGYSGKLSPGVEITVLAEPEKKPYTEGVNMDDVPF